MSKTLWLKVLELITKRKKPKTEYAEFFIGRYPNWPKYLPEGGPLILDRLWKWGWGENPLSHTYPGQWKSLRRLRGFMDQEHLRIYCDGTITAHREAKVEFPVEHAAEKDLRSLTPEEANGVFEMFLFDPTINASAVDYLVEQRWH